MNEYAKYELKWNASCIGREYTKKSQKILSEITNSIIS